MEDLTIPLPDEEIGTWDWLVMRDVPGGLSAHEMAEDLGITHEVAALRLAGYLRNQPRGGVVVARCPNFE